MQSLQTPSLCMSLLQLSATRTTVVEKVFLEAGARNKKLVLGNVKWAPP